MRAVVQRVDEAAVLIEGQTIGRIGPGLLVYLGVETDDSDADVRYMVDKICHLRVFPDAQGLMNRDARRAGGSVLLISAFTLAADARRGRRPAFHRAAPPDQARPLYDDVCAAVAQEGLHVERGSFGASMEVRSSNAGPVCILLDSRRGF